MTWELIVRVAVTVAVAAVLAGALLLVLRVLADVVLLLLRVIGRGANSSDRPWP